MTHPSTPPTPTCARWLVTLALCLSAIGALAARATDIRVVSSGAFAEAFRVLSPVYERQSGHSLIVGQGASMGDTPTAIPNRLKRGEPIDVVIMSDGALDGLMRQGQVLPGSKVVLVKSIIAMAVRAGAPKPDISTVEALTRALLAAPSIAYSDSASGVYLSGTLFPRLGIAERIKDRSRQVPGAPVGEVVARGEAAIGFQQLSELKPVRGIDIVGPLPADAQQTTLFSAGVVSSSKAPEAARALIAFLASPAAADAIRATGLEPVSATAR